MQQKHVDLCLHSEKSMPDTTGGSVEMYLLSRLSFRCHEMSVVK